MNGEHGPLRYPVHPARYFDASPTWFAWNKLSAADFSELRQERGFEGQNIYFYLNHPIRYVRLVGLVVAVDRPDIGSGTRFTLITIDDGSGVCVDVKVSDRKLDKDDTAEYPSTTAVDDIDVVTTLGRLTVLVDKQSVEVGTVLKVKGTIGTWRDYRRTPPTESRQLLPKRARVVKDTAAEASAWQEVADWKFTVLSQPWALLKHERDKIDLAIRHREKKQRSHAKRRREHEERYHAKRRRHEERAEQKQAKEERKMNQGALKGSDVVQMP